MTHNTRISTWFPSPLQPIPSLIPTPKSVLFITISHHPSIFNSDSLEPRQISFRYGYLRRAREYGCQRIRRMRRGFWAIWRRNLEMADIICISLLRGQGPYQEPEERLLTLQSIEWPLGLGQVTERGSRIFAGGVRALDQERRPVDILPQRTKINWFFSVSSRVFLPYPARRNTEYPEEYPRCCQIVRTTSCGSSSFGDSRRRFL